MLWLFINLSLIFSIFKVKKDKKDYRIKFLNSIVYDEKKIFDRFKIVAFLYFPFIVKAIQISFSDKNMQWNLGF